MRFICLYKPQHAETDRPPTQAEMVAMGGLIEDMKKAGVLLGVEGLLPSRAGVRVTIQKGDFKIAKGPFEADAHLVGGFCMLQTKTLDEAVEWCKRFLELVGAGQSEIRQLHEHPAG